MISAFTAYHPQSDGQTEHVNQELKQYIQVFMNEQQNDWDTLLPLGEFAYNNHIHSSTQHSPFFVLNFKKWKTETDGPVQLQLFFGSMDRTLKHYLRVQRFCP